MRDLVKMGGVLFIVCGLSAAALAVVNIVTREPIAAQVEIERREAFQMVMPVAEDFRERVTGVEWDALKGGKAIGAVISISTQGYGGPIAIAVGLDHEDRLTGMRVLAHNETPGLGAKITAAGFSGQFKGLQTAALKLKKDDPAAGQVDAITAATISSRAVTNAIRAAVERRAKGAKP